MISSFAESTASTAQPSGWMGDIWTIASQSMKTYLDYDLQREQAKIAKAQIAAGYNSGSQQPGAYDYTRFTDDGGLMGGFGGLKGDQVFLIAIAAVAAFAIARK